MLDVGVTAKVTGRRRAIAAVGPMPGSTPTRVPCQNTHKTEEKVHRIKGDAETHQNIMEETHGSPLKNPGYPPETGNEIVLRKHSSSQGCSGQER